MSRTKQADLEFMADVQALATRGVGIRSSVLLLLVVAFVIAILFWMSISEIDQVTKASGRVVPSSQMQVVQNLEGGIVGAILVREGDFVEAGQVVARIDDVSAAANLREAETQRAALKVEAARLEAEVAGTDPDWPAEVMTQRPDLIANEQALLLARAEELRSSIGVLESQLAQRSQEQAELEGRISSLRDSLRLTQEERAIIAPNVERGAVARIELVRIDQRLNEIRGELEAAQLALPRIRSARAETAQRIEGERTGFVSQTQARLNIVRNQLAAIAEQLTAREDRVTRTDVRAPVRGIVNNLLVTTVGGVVAPGAPLMEVVPVEDSLVIEANVNPKDVAFLRPDLAARVKLTAYDFAKFGSLEGRIVNISADTVSDAEGNDFYEIRIRTDRSYLGTEADPLPIIPGMIAEVDVVTGKRTILDYFLKPIQRAQDSALRER